MSETQYIKISETEFKEVVPQAPVENVATLDDLIILRDASERKVAAEQKTLDDLNVKILAVKALGVKTQEEVEPVLEEQP